MPSGKLIAKSDVEAMVGGSMERTISRLRASVRESKLFGESAGASLVATHPGLAIVGTREGKFFRVKFDESRNGIVLSSPEPYQVSVVDESSIGKLADQRVESIVEAVFGGKSVKGMLLEAAEMLPSDVITPLERAKAIISQVEDVARPWRAMVQSNRSKMRRFIENQLSSIKSRLPRQGRFSALYQGRVPASQAESMQQLVRSDLATLSDRLGGTAERVAKGITAFQNEGAGYRSPEDAIQVESLNRVIIDFVEDVSSIAESMKDLAKTEATLSDLGQVCDAVAARTEDIEVAAAFFEKTLKRAGESRPVA